MSQTANAITLPRLRPAKPSELTIGARVEYRGSWGRGVARTGTIFGGPDLNDDEWVWDVELDNGAKHWGYLEQFLIEEAA